MAEGANRMARSLVDLQPTAVIELFQLYYDYTNFPEAVFNFHGGTNGLDGPIVFDGYSYTALPVEVEGFETTANQKLPRPKVRISNDHLFMTDVLLRYNDLKDARLVRTRTLLKFLDEENFDGGVNPFGEPDPTSIISRDEYLVAQKIAENREVVELELGSPLDVENLTVPRRSIQGRYCFWQYRGPGCTYGGPLVEQEDETAFSKNPTGSFYEAVSWSTGSWATGDITYIENPKILIDTIQTIYPEEGDGLSGERFLIKKPLRAYYVCVSAHTTDSRESGFPPESPTLWEKDGCGKTISACQKRFKSGVISYSGESIANPFKLDWLPFGGFPATDNFQL
jgi:lambda family phage minor tail protein L